MEHDLKPNNNNIYTYLTSNSGLSSKDNENNMNSSNSLSFDGILFPDNGSIQDNSLETHPKEKVEESEIMTETQLETSKNIDQDQNNENEPMTSIESMEKEDKNNIDHKTFRIGDYRVWKTPIGHGSFSEVYKGYHQKTKRVVAIKSLKITRRNTMNRIKFEIKIMKDLDHPNIIKLYEVIEEDDDKIHLIMEYCSGGTLDKFIENCEILSEAQVHHYLKDLNLGLKYLRKKNILHRDLKPHNLLISEENSLKISDFGLSTLLENDKMTDTLCGSPLYMAPEVIMNNIYGVKSDLWSVGIIMYQLIYGKHPFNFKNIYELIQEINTREIEYPSVPISANCISLMKGLLVADNNKRICWGEFFKHPWITQAEFVESGYKISQPIRIGNRKEGFLNEFTIANYNPSFCQYDPITNSEPLVKGEHFKQFLQSSSSGFGGSNNNNNTNRNDNHSNNNHSNNNHSNNNIQKINNSDHASDQRVVDQATKSLKNSTVRKKIGHRYAVSYYRKKSVSRYPVRQTSTGGINRCATFNPRNVHIKSISPENSISTTTNSNKRNETTNETKHNAATASEIYLKKDLDILETSEKEKIEKEKRELEKREKELEKREKELAEREIIKINVSDSNSYMGDKENTKKHEIVEIKFQTDAGNEDMNIIDEDASPVDDDTEDMSLLSSFYGILSAPFRYFLNNR